MRIYLDTAPVIYTIERIPFYAATVDRRLSAPGIVLIASDLTRMECRVMPLRRGNTDPAMIKSIPINIISTEMSISSLND